MNPVEQQESSTQCPTPTPGSIRQIYVSEGRGFRTKMLSLPNYPRGTLRVTLYLLAVSSFTVNDLISAQFLILNAPFPINTPLKIENLVLYKRPSAVNVLFRLKSVQSALTQLQPPPPPIICLPQLNYESFFS